MLDRRDGARFPPDVTLGVQAKELNLGSHGLRVLRCLLANSKRAVMCLFTEEWLQSGPDWWSAAEMVVLLESSPISTKELCQSDHPGSLLPPRTRPFSPDCSVWPVRPALGRVLGVPNFFHLRTMEAAVFLRTFNAADIF